MKVSVISSVIVLLLFVQGCESETPKMQPVDSSPSPQILGISGISKDEAVATANASARKAPNSLVSVNIVACEQSLFWAILYDGDNSEYLIDKFSGQVVRIRQIPQALPDHAGPPERIDGISEQEAVDIARRDFRATHGSESDRNLVIRACELARVWRVVFDIKLTQEPGRDKPRLPDAHSPTYIIDKRTSDVLDRQLY
jgi:hypothetical protein